MHNSAWALRRGSSAVDWCEGNYLISPVIAEFVNTAAKGEKNCGVHSYVSNVLFFVLPPLLTGLFREYAQSINRGIYLIWALLLTVGITSAYFHATLSMVGQLLDELAILWLLSASVALWLPRRFIPMWLKNDRKSFQILIFVISIAATVLACVQPAVNAFALMWFGLPATILLIVELQRCKNVRVVRLGFRCALVWILALTCWINDRLFCDLWSSFNFPYLHGAWHLLIAIASYTACVLFAYFHACAEAPEQHPVLRFWPSDRFEFGVPYVTLKSALLKRDVDC